MYTILFDGVALFTSEFLDDIEEWFVDNGVNPVGSMFYRVDFESLDD